MKSSFDELYGVKAPVSPAYGRLIKEATGCADDELGGIEQLMRDVYRTLDGLSRIDFFKAARTAYVQLRLLRG